MYRFSVTYRVTLHVARIFVVLNKNNLLVYQKFATFFFSTSNKRYTEIISFSAEGITYYLLGNRQMCNVFV